MNSVPNGHPRLCDCLIVAPLCNIIHPWSSNNLWIIQRQSDFWDTSHRWSYNQACKCNALKTTTRITGKGNLFDERSLFNYLFTKQTDSFPSFSDFFGTNEAKHRKKGFRWSQRLSKRFRELKVTAMMPLYLHSIIRSTFKSWWTQKQWTNMGICRLSTKCCFT